MRAHARVELSAVLFSTVQGLGTNSTADTQNVGSAPACTRSSTEKQGAPWALPTPTPTHPTRDRESPPQHHVRPPRRHRPRHHRLPRPHPRRMNRPLLILSFQLALTAATATVTMSTALLLLRRPRHLDRLFYTGTILLTASLAIGALTIWSDHA